MWRIIASVVGGIVAWALIVTCLNIGLRVVLPGYQEAEPQMRFTLAMQIGRLMIATLSSFAAGGIVRVVAPESRWVPWITGGIILALFIPQHIRLWDHFPIWYHLAFLVPLAPLFAAGAWATSRANARR